MSINQKVVWKKSTRSVGQGACVEVANCGDLTLIRDSKNPDGEVLAFSFETVRNFVNAVKRR